MEAQDKFERDIRARKKGLDQLKPKPDLWAAIEAELETEAPVKNSRPKVFSLYQSWKPMAAAAAVAGIMALAFVLGRAGGIEEGRQDAFAEMESIYLDSINGIRAQVGKFEFVDLEVEEEFADDLAALDSAYSNLGRTVGASADPTLVREAMIENLHLRIQLLQQQLYILQGIQQQKTKHEKVI